MFHCKEGLFSGPIASKQLLVGEEKRSKWASWLGFGVVLAESIMTPFKHLPSSIAWELECKHCRKHLSLFPLCFHCTFEDWVL